MSGDLSRDLVSHALDACETGLVVLDHEGRVVLWNHWMEDASGLAADEARDGTLVELFPETAGTRVESAVGSALTRGMASVLSHHLNRFPLPLFTAGTASACEVDLRQPMAQMVHVRPIVGEGSKRHCMIQVADVSSSVKREQLLLGQAAKMQDLMRENQRSAARTRTILDGAMEGIVTLDGSGRIETANPAAEAIFGYPADDLVGKHVRTLIQGEIELGSGGEVLGHRRDGREFPAEISVSALETEEGAMQVLVIRDVTQRAEMERELKDFVRVASHDLQSPLNTIMHFARRELRRGPDVLDQRSRECLEQISEASRRMSRLVHDLGSYSRAGYEGRAHRALPLGGIVQMAMENLQHAVAESGAQVTAGELPSVLGDQTQLVQIFQNLIGNALKFAGDASAVVHVEARPEGESQWRVSVADNGIGVDPSDQEKIFQVFQRLHSEAAYPGSGVGLATCKRIIERHGGRLWIESAVGRGSVFYFTLTDASGGDRSKVAASQD